MGIYEELKARGLIAQVTDEAQIREMINAGKDLFERHFLLLVEIIHGIDGRIKSESTAKPTFPGQTA